MPGMQVGGLASGLDTNSIIAQLTALEQAKVTREVQKKESAQKTLDKFKELETRLGNLEAKAKGLNLPSSFNLFKSTSNYEDYATISGGEGATAGQYELKVHQLATTQKVSSNSFGSIISSMGSEDGWTYGDTVTLSLSKSAAALKTDPSKKEVDIKINSSDTLKDIANKINAAEGSGVKASLMTMANGENRLILTAVDTGTKSFYINENGGTSFLSDVLGIVEEGKQQATTGDAFLTKTGAATEETTFAELYSGLGSSNKLLDGDVMSIKIGSEVVTATISGNKTIGDVLEELNSQLSSGFKAALNSSGEIYITSDEAFNYEHPLGDTATAEEIKEWRDNFFKIQILDGNDNNKVKKDFGKLSVGNVFAEDNVINHAVNAFYTVDGMAVSSQSNSDSKTIMGTTFTLKKADPSLTIKVSLEADMEGLAGKINDFIEEFNALLKFIDENSKATVTEEEDKATGKKYKKREVGAFTGESNISSLRENLKRMLTSTIDEITGKLGNGYSTDYSSAARVGITTGKDGYMTVDKDKLTKALNSDFEGVRRLFTAGSFSDQPGYTVGRFGKDAKTGIYEISATGEITLNGKLLEGVTSFGDGSILTTADGLSFEVPLNGTGAKVTFVRGIASQLSTFVENARTSSNLNSKGFFKETEKTYQNRIDTIEKRINELQGRVDRYSMRITAQFNALERSMNTLQSQTANMMSALGGMSYRR
jgi:flagellar capping protein FliD